MRIHEIIRERRTANGLTQEQVASYLGVSAPAVNKWEKAVSYPDITLLPALARLLGTDLNTLLSFKEEMSQWEIARFMEELTAAAMEQGGDCAFETAMEKIREFPSCGPLLLNTALTLEGVFAFLEEGESDSSYMEKINQLYQRAAESQDVKTRSTAQGMLASKYINQGEYEKAEELLGRIPDRNTFDKNHLQARLYMKQERWADAAKLIEQKIMSEVNSVSTSLAFLMEIAFYEERTADAEQIADVAGQLVKLFDMWEYGSYAVYFQLAVMEKDQEKCLAVLKKMIPSMLTKWKPSQSVLYPHIQEKESEENLGERMLPQMVREFEKPENHELDFVREHPEFRKLLAYYKEQL